jgi:hypothetical protein
MPEIKVLRADTGIGAADIRQLPVYRDWMDATDNKHAYHCFPMSLTNRMGWGISFPEDITFVWDGISNSSNEHVKILSGSQYCSTNRGNATISFHCNFYFKTDENTTMLVMPVPNQFIDGAQCFTTLISTSFLNSAIPIAWRITRPNVEITIPAGTPVASVIPMSVGNLETYELLVEDANFTQEDWDAMKNYGNAVHQHNYQGEWSNFYKNATDENRVKIGSHEVKNINLKTTDNTKNARN